MFGGVRCGRRRGAVRLARTYAVEEGALPVPSIEALDHDRRILMTTAMRIGEPSAVMVAVCLRQLAFGS